MLLELPVLTQAVNWREISRSPSGSIDAWQSFRPLDARRKALESCCSAPTSPPGCGQQQLRHLLLRRFRGHPAGNRDSLLFFTRLSFALHDFRFWRIALIVLGIDRHKTARMRSRPGVGL